MEGSGGPNTRSLVLPLHDALDEELLRQSGIEAGKGRDLVAEFRKSATGK